MKDDRTVPDSDSGREPETASNPAPRAEESSSSGDSPWNYGPALGVGDLLAERYRIVSYLGQGAMGEVYEASDLELGGRIAVKTLRHSIGSTADSIERFKREILLARRVSHPNVCRIFDLGMHRIAGSSKPLLFLTMELLPGETLTRRVEREGPLPEPAIFVVLEQLARGLEAAHRAGVVHRDLKSSNVMLVPEKGGERAVITDFGLARSHTSDGASSSGGYITQSGGLLGTPAYMSPEQVEGKSATTSSDLYSLGVVAYEMTTGELPFPGASPLSVAVKRLKEDPVPPQTHRSDLSPRLKRILALLLARRPEDRFADASTLVAALGEEGLPATPGASSRGRRRRGIAAAAIAALVAAGGGVVWKTQRHRGATVSSAAPSERRRAIAMLGFANTSGREDAAWLAPAFVEMIGTELAADGALRLVPLERVERTKSGLGLARARSLDRPTLGKVRDALGDATLVFGSYVAPPNGDTLGLYLHVQDVVSGETKEVIEQGAATDLFSLVARTARDIRSRLGVAAFAPGSEESLRAAQPGSTTAARDYAEGLELLRRADPKAARERLERAVAEDPTFALAREALARAWSELGYSEKALSEARSARELAAALPEAQRLAVTARADALAGDWKGAVEAWSALAIRFPDDLDYGLDRSDALIQSGRAREALAELDRLRKLPPPDGVDPRIEAISARAALATGDAKQSVEFARKADRRARETGETRVEIEAKYLEAQAERKLANAAGALRAMQEAYALATASTDLKLIADAGLRLGSALRQTGDRDGAAKLFDAAGSKYEAIGNRRGVAQVALARGILEYERGRLADALREYESAYAAFHEIGDEEAAAAALANSGSVYYLRGDLAEALKRHEATMPIFRARGNDGRLLTALLNVAPIRLERGDLADAEAACREAVALGAKTHAADEEAKARATLGDVLIERGEIAAARQELAGAEAILRQGAESEQLATVAIQFARAEITQGQFEKAASRLEALSKQLDSSDLGDEREWAAALLAEADLGAGRLAAARDIGGTRLAGGPKSEVKLVRHAVRIAQARLAAAVHDLPAARALLEKEASEARTAGRRLAELECRIVAAAIAPASPDAAKRRSALEQLRDQASRLGAGRLVAEATRALATS